MTQTFDEKDLEAAEKLTLGICLPYPNEQDIKWAASFILTARTEGAAFAKEELQPDYEKACDELLTATLRLAEKDAEIARLGRLVKLKESNHENAANNAQKLEDMWHRQQEKILALDLENARMAAAIKAVLRDSVENIEGTINITHWSWNDCREVLSKRKGEK